MKTLINGVRVLIFFPREDFDQIRLFAHGGRVALKGGKGYALAGIW